MFEEKLDISLVVEEKIDIQEKIKAEKEEEKQKQETIPTFVWYVLAALIAVLFLTIILQAIRIRKYKAAEEARL